MTKHTHMRQPNLAFCLAVALTAASPKTQAQTRIGYINMSELVQLMPGYKKANSSLTNYQAALAQRYQQMGKEFNQKDSALAGRDTAALTPEVRDVKRKALNDLYTQIQGFSQNINPLLQQR